MIADIHTHMLYVIDDGASGSDMSLAFMGMNMPMRCCIKMRREC